MSRLGRGGGGSVWGWGLGGRSGEGGGGVIGWAGGGGVRSGVGGVLGCGVFV